jgi:hypothetical protein
MSISHVGRSEILNDTQEVDPHLEVISDTDGGISSLVDFDLFECLG